MIWYQILQTDIMRIIWQTVRRIADEILGVKGLILYLLTRTTVNVGECPSHFVWNATAEKPSFEAL